MIPSEKRLYSQIHPAKLFTDISMSIVSLYLFWLHDLVPALILHLVPSVVVSLVIIQFVDLTKYRDSALGRYVNRNMTREMEIVRIMGDIVTIAGGWLQALWIIEVGIVVVTLGWTFGLAEERL